MERYAVSIVWLKYHADKDKALIDNSLTIITANSEEESFGIAYKFQHLNFEGWCVLNNQVLKIN